MMMKKTIFMLGVIGTLSTVLLSCGKDARIGRNLWKKGGEWNIETAYREYKYVISGTTTTETEHNVGTFTFNKGGTGKLRDSDGDIETFTYSNTQKTLTIEDTWGTDVYDIIEWKKDNLKISRNYSELMGPAKELLTLKKK